MPSNQDLLQAILENQRIDREENIRHRKEINVKFLQLAADFSEYKNKQEPINIKILSILNNDKDSSRIGLVDQVEENKKDIATIKIVDKVRVGQGKVLSIVSGAIGGAIFYIIKLLI